MHAEPPKYVVTENEMRFPVIASTLHQLMGYLVASHPGADRLDTSVQVSRHDGEGVGDGKNATAVRRAHSVRRSDGALASTQTMTARGTHVELLVLLQALGGRNSIRPRCAAHLVRDQRELLLAVRPFRDGQSPGDVVSSEAPLIPRESFHAGPLAGSERD